MFRQISIALAVVFAVASGSATAHAKGGGSHHASHMHNVSHTQKMNMPPRNYMGGSKNGPIGTPENPGTKGGQEHMGGSATGPKGTPENPGQPSNGGHCGNDNCNHGNCDHGNCNHGNSGSGPVYGHGPVVHGPVYGHGPVLPPNGFANGVWKGMQPGTGTTTLNPNLQGLIGRDHAGWGLAYGTTAGGSHGKGSNGTSSPGGRPGANTPNSPQPIQEGGITAGTLVNAAGSAIGDGLSAVGNLFGIGYGSITP